MKGDMQRINLRITQLERNCRILRKKNAALEKEIKIMKENKMNKYDYDE